LGNIKDQQNSEQAGTNALQLLLNSALYLHQVLGDNAVLTIQVTDKLME